VSDTAVKAAHKLAAIDRKDPTPTAPVIEPFPTLKLCDVPDLGPTRWLIQDIWADQGCGFVGGAPKGGKSWLGIEAGISIASGLKMLGRFEVDRGRVLHFNAEDKPGRTKERARMMCRAKGIELASLDFHVLDVPRFALDNPEHVERMGATIAQQKPKLVILDPLRRLHRLDEDKAGDMDPLLDVLRGWQREYGCSVMLVHHITKAGDASGRALRGSSVFHAWLDSALYVTPKGKLWNDSRKVDLEHRDSENSEPFEWALHKEELFNGDVAIELRLDEEEATEQLSVDENSVISILQASTAPLTSTQITKAARKRNGWARRSRQRLPHGGNHDRRRQR
jgi:RecA-family ATPase